MIQIEQIRPEHTWLLRQKVLYPERKPYEMMMENDDSGIHFGAFRDDDLIGVVSLFQNGDDFQFRKFAVEPASQGRGVGTALLAYITNFARTQGGTRLWCNARLSAVSFYTRHNFRPTGQLFFKNGNDYEIFEKELADTKDFN